MSKIYQRRSRRPVQRKGLGFKLGGNRIMNSNGKSQLFNDILSKSTIQRTGNKFSNRQQVIQQWSIPGNVKKHIFDGERSSNNLTGFHSQARKNKENGKLKYENEGVKDSSAPYRANVKVKINSNYVPTGEDRYKMSDMFPASWNENTIVEAIEQAYENKHNWKPGKKLGNAKGIPIVFVGGDSPTTIYPHIR